MSRTCGFDQIQNLISSVKFLHESTGHAYAGNTFEINVRGLKIKPALLLLL